MKRVAVAGFALAAALGCRDDVTGPNYQYVFEALSPTSLEATVGTVIQDAPSVIVKDHSGRPVANIAVVFRFHEPVDESAKLVRTLEVRTNEQGIASAGEWMLGLFAGPHLVQATIFGAPQLWFTANAVPDAPAALLLMDENYTQIGLAGMAVQPPRVRVTDRYGNNVLGVSVAFTISAGSGTLEGADAVTDANGAAAAAWTLGTSLGANTVTARALDLPSIDFTVEVVAASAIYDLTMIDGESPDHSGIASGFIALTADGRFVSHLSGYGQEDGVRFMTESGTYVIDGSRALLRYSARGEALEVGSLENGILRLERYDEEGPSRTWQYAIRN